MLVNQMGIHYPTIHASWQINSRLDTHYLRGFLPAPWTNLLLAVPLRADHGGEMPLSEAHPQGEAFVTAHVGRTDWPSATDSYSRYKKLYILLFPSCITFFKDF